MKTCARCKTEKPLVEFRKEAKGRQGRDNYCKACRSERRKEEWARRKPEVAAINRVSYLKTKWGMTVAEYEAMLEAQGGGCAICGRTKSNDYHINLCIDHCHTTGKIRGLLCTNCNRSLATIFDDLESAHRLVEYLKRNQV